MNDQNQFSAVSRSMVVFAAFIVIIAGLKNASNIVVPLIFAMFIAVVFAPLFLWLRRMHVPTALALIAVIGTIVGGATVIGIFMGNSIQDFTASVPAYTQQIEGELQQLYTRLEGWGIPIPTDLARQYFDPASVMPLVANVLNSFSGLLANGFLILVTVCFMLIEAGQFGSKIQYLSDSPTATMERARQITSTVNTYVVIKTLVSVITGICVAVWLTILGVDYPVLWGLLAFLLNYVPNIGSLIASIPAILLATVQLGLAPAALTAIGYFVINTVMGNMVEPRWLGKQLGLSTLIVFLSLVFWGWVFGPVGMLLSVPLTMTLKLILDYLPETRWLAVLLGSQHDFEGISALDDPRQLPHDDSAAHS